MSERLVLNRLEPLHPVKTGENKLDPAVGLGHKVVQRVYGVEPVLRVGTEEQVTLVQEDQQLAALTSVKPRNDTVMDLRAYLTGRWLSDEDPKMRERTPQ
jgi:hypothetical protein